MDLSHKFTIFFVFITIYLAKAQNHRNIFHFKQNENRDLIKMHNKTEIPFQISTPIPIMIPVKAPSFIPNPCIHHSSHVFSFSNVGLQKIGRDFITSDDIISLHLDNNDINEISPFAFHKVPKLRYLDLSGNKIPKEKLLSWAGNANLRVLIIDNNRDSHNPVKNILKEYDVFSNLKFLQLCNSQLGNFQIPFFLAVPTLTHLQLSNNSINASDVVFDNIPATLTHLYLNENSIDRVKPDKLRYKCL